MNKEQYNSRRKELGKRLDSLASSAYLLEKEVIKVREEYGNELLENGTYLTNLTEDKFEYNSVQSLSIIVQNKYAEAHIHLDGVTLASASREGVYQEINGFDESKDEWVKLVRCPDDSEWWVLMSAEVGKEHIELEHTFCKVIAFYSVDKDNGELCCE